MTATAMSPTGRDVARDALMLDLTTSSLQIGDWYASFDSPAADEILDVYLDLIRDLRGSEAALTRGLRSDDLAVLGAVLEHEPDGLHERLTRLIAQRTSLRARLRPSLVGIAGVLAVVASAALVVTLVWRATGADTRADQRAASVAAVSVAPPSPILSDVAPLTAAAAPSGALDELAEARTVGANGSETAQSGRAAEIEGLIGWDFRGALPGWTIVHTDRHPTWRGLTNSVERTVTLFDRPEESPAAAAAVLAHELGHAVDLDHLDDDRRNAWRELRGITGPWWAEDGLADFAVGAGDFAEAVAAVLVGAPSQSNYGPFDTAQLDFVADILDDLG